MENNPAPLRLASDNPNPWNRPEAYSPEAIARIRARLNGKPRHIRIGFFSTLRDDFRDVLSEIGAHPYSHALVGLATFLGTIALLVVPTLVLR